MQLINREDYDKYLFPNYSPLQIIPERGEGVKIWDTNGIEYLDFAAGIAVSALGHAHPELVKALTEQAQKFWHVSNILTTQPALNLARTLVENTFAERVIFSNSGAEANEGALKLARRYAHDKFGPEKVEIIAFDQAFHGRTFFTVSVGGQAKYSDGFGPKPGAITHLPFNDIEAFKSAISERTCAVIIEPMQGEGGIHPMTQEFATEVRALCTEHNALLIFDEIQTGVMRTGKLFAYEHFGVEPDILTSAKGLGGGFPIAATLSSEEIASVLTPGTHGSTYAGNPMGCAVANRVIELVNTPEMEQNVSTTSALIRSEIDRLNAKYDLFTEVRGMGLLIGAELKAEYAGKAREIMVAAQAEQLLCLVAGPDVLRFAPPLIVTEAEILEGMKRLDKALAKFLA